MELWELLDATCELRRSEFEASLREKRDKPVLESIMEIDRFESVTDPPALMDKWVRKTEFRLTAEQEEAIERSLHESVAVYAGPGSGKTACLVERVRRVAQTLKPTQILCVTFTKAAAREMKRRSGVNAEFRTTHSLAYKILSADGSYYRVLHEMKLIRRIIERLDLDMSPDEFLMKWTYHKCSDTGPSGMTRYPFKLGSNPMVILDELEFESDEEERFWTIAAEITLEMLNRNEVTYDDMLLWARDKVEQGMYHPVWKDISIDEAHDLNRAQFNFIQAIVDKTEARLFVLASPEQSIYSFRYAMPDTLEEFVRRNGLTRMRLKLNHRSGRVLVDYANRIFDISVPALEGEGTLINLGQYPDVFSEAFDIVKRASNTRASTAIIARTNSATVPLIMACVDLRVPYKAVRTFLNSPLTRAVEDLVLLASRKLELDSTEAIWLKRYLMIGERELRNSLREIYDPQSAIAVMMRKILPNAVVQGDKDDDALLRWLHEASKRFSTFTQFLEFLEKARALNREDARILIGTIHSVKGLEFDVVFMIGLNEGLLPHSKNPFQDEELRVFYVGLTRARRRLYLSGHRERDAKPSRFLEKLKVKPGVNK